MATLFLRACLDGGDRGAHAWSGWKRRVGDPAAAFRARGELRRLGPLLDRGLRDSGVEEPGDAFRTALRASAVHEQRRAEAFARDTGTTLRALHRCRIDATVLRGAALAELAYPQPWLRHCHDVDLLVGGDQSAAALAALTRECGPGGAGSGPLGRRDARYVHAHGLPVALHSRPLAVPGARALTARTLERSVGDAPALVPSPEDMLLLVCAHGLAGPVPGRLSWVPDAWFALQATPALDWDRLRATATETRLVRLLAVALGYLRRELGAAIPRDELERVRLAARDGGAAGSAVALAALWRARGRGRRFGQVRP